MFVSRRCWQSINGKPQRGLAGTGNRKAMQKSDVEKRCRKRKNAMLHHHGLFETTGASQVRGTRIGSAGRSALRHSLTWDLDLSIRISLLGSEMVESPLGPRAIRFAGS
jgi:hypothetical protein